MRLFICGLLFVSVNTFGQSDFWVMTRNSDDQYGYVDQKGKVKIPFGKYLACFTDTFKAFGIVLMKPKGFVGIDKNESVLFKVYPFDNGPDYPEGGLFRITENDLIGFANTKGQIVIKPKFKSVLTFTDNLAAYCDNCVVQKDGEHWWWTEGKWGFIDKQGDVAIKATYDDIVEPFRKGKAKVKLKAREFWIDEHGNEI